MKFFIKLGLYCAVVCAGSYFGSKFLLDNQKYTPNTSRVDKIASSYDSYITDLQKNYKNDFSTVRVSGDVKPSSVFSNSVIQAVKEDESKKQDSNKK